MPQWLQELQNKPWVAHVLRATTRYGSRLGSQFAAAIAYFSVLSLVPIIMFAFASVGFVVSGSPDLQRVIQDEINSALAGAPMADQLSGIVLNAFTNWQAVGIIAVLSGAYSGAGWIGNIKSAVSGQMRPTLDIAGPKKNIITETLKNLGLLVVFLLILALTFVLSGIATGLASTLINAIGLSHVPGIGLLFRLVPIVVSLLAGFVLFRLIFAISTDYRPPRQAVNRGSMIGAVGLAILQYLLGFLLQMFSGSPTAALFGPVIAIMLFLNIFAQLILWLACWIATANQVAIPGDHQDCDDPLEASDITILSPQAYAAMTGHDGADKQVRNRQPVGGPARSTWQPPDYPKPVTLTADGPVTDDSNEVVSTQVAARGVRIAMASGWLVGIGSGLGIGAVITAVANKIARR